MENGDDDFWTTMGQSPLGFWHFEGCNEVDYGEIRGLEGKSQVVRYINGEPGGE
ncbi:hypothetical protein HPP92_000181 [Vanilla planifolia]|uniref:Uncharacterized protein n=1 Tax=Vanilla planifolia TaxID=51239 RepID=A0A835VFV1_VANPL|nr:hypothetical protein HPP92_000181 [Vanilla planifolia]